MLLGFINRIIGIIVIGYFIYSIRKLLKEIENGRKWDVLVRDWFFACILGIIAGLIFLFDKIRIWDFIRNLFK
jgi:hypothetical protein